MPVNKGKLIKLSLKLVLIVKSKFGFQLYRGVWTIYQLLVTSQ